MVAMVTNVKQSEISKNHNFEELSLLNKQTFLILL